MENFFIFCALLSLLGVALITAGWWRYRNRPSGGHYAFADTNVWLVALGVAILVVVALLLAAYAALTIAGRF